MHLCYLNSGQRQKNSMNGDGKKQIEETCIFGFKLQKIVLYGIIAAGWKTIATQSAAETGLFVFNITYI